jgi:hypothetical protein
MTPANVAERYLRKSARLLAPVEVPVSGPVT